MVRSLVISLVFGLYSTTALADSVFDPSSYLAQSKEQPDEKAPNLLTRSVYRIDGIRYIKVNTDQGSVYLPGLSTNADLSESKVVCSHHIKLIDDVFAVRDGLPITNTIQKNRTEIGVLIRKCQAGKIPFNLTQSKKKGTSRVVVGVAEKSEYKFSH